MLLLVFLLLCHLRERLSHGTQTDTDGNRDRNRNAAEDEAKPEPEERQHFHRKNNSETVRRGGKTDTAKMEILHHRAAFKLFSPKGRRGVASLLSC